MFVITLARKPSKDTVALTVLEHGTSALSIDVHRIGDGADKGIWPVTGREGRTSFNSAVDGSLNKPVETDTSVGRWPANLLLAHRPGCGSSCVAGCPVDGLDRQTGVLTSGSGAVKRASSADRAGNRGAAYGSESRKEGTPMVCYGDSGGASRFFHQLGGERSSEGA